MPAHAPTSPPHFWEDIDVLGDNKVDFNVKGTSWTLKACYQYSERRPVIRLLYTVTFRIHHDWFRKAKPFSTRWLELSTLYCENIYINSCLQSTGNGILRIHCTCLVYHAVIQQILPYIFPSCEVLFGTLCSWYMVYFGCIVFFYWNQSKFILDGDNRAA